MRLIPAIGPIRAAILIAVMQTPHRFRTKRHLWTYSGLGLETYDSGEYHAVQGQLERSKKQATVRGLNRDYKHDLKDIFKGAAMRASTKTGPLHDFYQGLLAKGRKPTMARLTLARKIAAITLIVWKKEVRFDANYLKPQAACLSLGSMPTHFLPRHSAQLSERKLLLWEWSSPGERFSFVSACEPENQLFFPVVPLRGCDGAFRFSETQQAGRLSTRGVAMHGPIGDSGLWLS